MLGDGGVVCAEVAKRELAPALCFVPLIHQDFNDALHKRRRERGFGSGKVRVQCSTARRGTARHGTAAPHACCRGVS